MDWDPWPGKINAILELAAVILGILKRKGRDLPGPFVYLVLFDFYNLAALIKSAVTADVVG